MTRALGWMGIEIRHTNRVRTTTRIVEAIEDAEQKIEPRIGIQAEQGIEWVSPTKRSDQSTQHEGDHVDKSSLRNPTAIVAMPPPMRHHTKKARLREQWRGG